MRVRDTLEFARRYKYKPANHNGKVKIIKPKKERLNNGENKRID